MCPIIVHFNINHFTQFKVRIINEETSQLFIQIFIIAHVLKVIWRCSNNIQNSQTAGPNTVVFRLGYFRLGWVRLGSNLFRLLRTRTSQYSWRQQQFLDFSQLIANKMVSTGATSNNGRILQTSPLIKALYKNEW